MMELVLQIVAAVYIIVQILTASINYLYHEKTASSD